MEWLFVVGRILFGGFFILNGFNHFMHRSMMAQFAASKGVPASLLMVLLTGLMMLFGGAGILLGLYIQWVVLALTIFLLTAAFWMHAFWNETDPTMRMMQMAFFLRNLALVGALFMILVIPAPWPYALL